MSIKADGFPAPRNKVAILIGVTGIDRAWAELLVRIGGALRALKDHDLEEGVSTRLLVYAATLIPAGLDPGDACLTAPVELLCDRPGGWCCSRSASNVRSTSCTRTWCLCRPR
ncbi:MULTISPECIES: CbbQ/NirQ/NorQ C-terminal domain-containing protein [unclassified Thiocapsa]|uniref:CbbQ/NirQ/NorQ domain-containing protein n=1 Tax=unclassified Thiocapsa TaxID=2641286 RepID=UPI0035B24FD4